MNSIENKQVDVKKQRIDETDLLNDVKRDELKKHQIDKTNLLNEVKREALDCEVKRMNEKKQKDEGIQKRIIESITNKSNWTYDVKNDEYTLIGYYEMKFLKDDELRVLFRTHLENEMISVNMVLIRPCDCDVICRCRKKHIIKFKD